MKSSLEKFRCALLVSELVNTLIMRHFIKLVLALESVLSIQDRSLTSMVFGVMAAGFTRMVDGPIAWAQSHRWIKFYLSMYKF